MSIKLKLFGIFKDYLSNEFCIYLHGPFDISYLRNYIAEKILVGDLSFLREVLGKSVFSNAEMILHDKYKLKEKEIICLLPPFSGG